MASFCVRLSKITHSRRQSFVGISMSSIVSFSSPWFLYFLFNITCVFVQLCRFKNQRFNVLWLPDLCFKFHLMVGLTVFVWRYFCSFSKRYYIFRFDLLSSWIMPITSFMELLFLIFFLSCLYAIFRLCVYGCADSSNASVLGNNGTMINSWKNIFC